MSAVEVMEDLEIEVCGWRHDIHCHPELAYEEVRTSKLVVNVLRAAGLKVYQGVGGTGVVGVLQKGKGKKSIALRADMDALPLLEETNLPYKSVVRKKMHACGHDGHTAMLLGAAKLLAESVIFDGTVYFIFQPAEEHLNGAYSMIDDRLFEIAPADAYFGMHNWPGLPVGKFAICEGPMMASFDKFDICIKGVGGHGALPHKGVDPIMVSSQVITNLQSIVSRTVDPLESAVISVTHIRGGEPSYNVIPNEVVLKGAVRSLSQQIRTQIKGKINHIVNGICDGLGATCEVSYEEVCPVLVNQPNAVEQVVLATSEVVGRDNVLLDIDPVMGSEDFAAILEEKPGAYLFIGNGDGVGSCMVHNPKYDFNDEAIPYGIKFWCQIVKSQLSI